MATEGAGDGGFDKLEPANLVILGDRKGQSKKFGGLLIDIIPDDQYPDKVRYVCVGVDGTDYEVAGNAALSKRIKKGHIGCLIKFVFEGREKGQRNEFKKIEVFVQPRDRTTDKQKELFPAWHDFDEEGKEKKEPADNFDEMG